MASKDKGKQGFLAENYEPTVINKWDGNAVKNALDDTAKEFMTQEYDCVEDFGLFDVRIFLCTVACLFSVLALGYDYYRPFPESKMVLAACSISYFVLMGVLTLFASYKEKSIFMVALEKNKAGLGPDNVWRLSSRLPRFSHHYMLKLEYTVGDRKIYSSEETEMSVASWFDEEGRLVVEKFHADFSDLYIAVKNKKSK